MKSLTRQFLTTFNGSLKAFLDEENAVIRESHFAGAPGNEIEGPMAAVILGGLVTSTALNLLVLPALASRWLRFKNSTGRYPAPVAGQQQN